MVITVSSPSLNCQTDLNQTEFTIPMTLSSTASLSCEDRLVKRIADLVDPLMQKISDLFSLMSTLTTTITASLPSTQATSQALAISKREIVNAAAEISDIQQRARNIVIRGRFKTERDPTSFARDLLQNIVNAELLEKLQYAQWLRKNVGRSKQTEFSGVIVTFSSAPAASEIISLSTGSANLPKVRSITKDYSFKEREAYRASKGYNKNKGHSLKSLRVLLTPLKPDSVPFPMRKHLSSPDLRVLQGPTQRNTPTPLKVSDQFSSCESLATVINCQPIQKIHTGGDHGVKKKFITSTPTAPNPSKRRFRARRPRHNRFIPVWTTPVEVKPQISPLKPGRDKSKNHFRLQVGNRVRPKGISDASRRLAENASVFRAPMRIPIKPLHQSVNPHRQAWITSTPQSQTPPHLNPLLTTRNFLYSPPPILNQWPLHPVPGPINHSLIGRYYPHPNGPCPQFPRTA